MYITDIRDEDVEISVKVVIVGNGAVGKSSMIQRYCRGSFTKTYKKTIGVDFLEKQLRIHGEDVRLMLWDTAGQEEFDAITKAYYRGAQACVVAFSTTDRDSLLAVRKWKKKVEDECGDIPMVLVQNKIDLISQSDIDQFDAERLAGEVGMRLYRTSVKEDLNVGSVFQHLAENYVNKVKSYDMSGGSYQSLQIGQSFPSHHSFTNHQTRQPPRPRSLRKTTSSFVLPDYSSRISLNPGRRRSSNYCDPCSDYLNNPMFESLQGRRYWNSEKGITLRPFSTKKHSYKPINVKSACRVL